MQSGRLLALLRAAGPGLLDQAVISLASLATHVLLARTLDRAEFGAFVLAYAVLLIVSGVQAALITQPHNVLAATERGDAYASRTTSIALAQAAFTAAVALAAVLAAAAALALGSAVAGTALAVAAATVGWQALEFTRRVLYTEGRASASLAIDAVGWGGHVAVLGLLAVTDRLGAHAALYTLGAATLGAALIGVRLIGPGLRGAYRRSALSESLQFGKWLAGATVVYTLSAQVWFYLAGAIVNAAASGALRAGQLILAPLHVLQAFLSTVLPIRFAQALEGGGQQALRRDTARAMTLAMPVVVVYCTVAAVFAEPLLRLAFGDKYAAEAELVRVFAGTYMAAFIASIFVAALSARLRARTLLAGNLVALALSMAIGLPLTVRQGVVGAAVGLLATAVSLAAWNGVAFARDAGPRSAPRPGA